MKKKKLLSFLLVLAMLFTMPGMPVSASAKGTSAGSAALARTKVSVEGTDDLGSMLAEEISRASADEAERESQSAYITDLTVSGDTAEVTYFAGGGSGHLRCGL